MFVVTYVVKTQIQLQFLPIIHLEFPSGSATLKHISPKPELRTLHYFLTYFIIKVTAVFLI